MNNSRKDSSASVKVCQAYRYLLLANFDLSKKGLGQQAFGTISSHESREGRETLFQMVLLRHEVLKLHLKLRRMPNVYEEEKRFFRSFKIQDIAEGINQAP